MTPGERAEARVAELGITDARDLDVEAIAFDAGVEVAYERLNGCEATLVGFVGRAIATINPSNSRGRERFSIAHEVGHWELHRGQSFRCRGAGPDENLMADLTVEKEADVYAAHLLMPDSLFNPAIRAFGKPGFRQLRELKTQFNTSLMATALRLAHINTLPVIVACYNRTGLCWHVAAGDVPRRWWLKRQLDEDTFTFDLLNHGKECGHLGKQPADAWFDNDDAGNYEVLEQCIATKDDEALVLIYLADKAMLFARFDPSVGNRRYNEFGSYVPSGTRPVKRAP